ncbi:hypothetical protein FN846DRAFT_571132 [Sphaerosporella brunnea]|uniref:Uncharacterized protein n=1 Tax=Sphaerosporella brunnea TaxID=1250544 RepID=A0A5J5F294_9PEZI|nr:hypothetical protein FN846DRAFT_571132 [Sphaerosporella brunnea]
MAVERRSIPSLSVGKKNNWRFLRLKTTSRAPICFTGTLDRQDHHSSSFVICWLKLARKSPRARQREAIRPQQNIRRGTPRKQIRFQDSSSARSSRDGNGARKICKIFIFETCMFLEICQQRSHPPVLVQNWASALQAGGVKDREIGTDRKAKSYSIRKGPDTSIGNARTSNGVACCCRTLWGGGWYGRGVWDLPISALWQW